MIGRYRLLLVLPALAFLGPGAPARAIPFGATLRFDVTNTLGAASFTGSGSGNSMAGAVTLPGDFVQGTSVLYYSDLRLFKAGTQVALRLLGNEPGQLSGLPSPVACPCAESCSSRAPSEANRSP